MDQSTDTYDVEILLDSQAIREVVLPRAEDILNEKIRRLGDKKREAELLLEGPTRDVQFWEKRVAALITLAAGDDAAGGSDEKSQPAEEQSASEAGPATSDSVLDLVVAVVEREPREIRAKDVREALVKEGHSVSAQSVSNSLYYAAHTANRIKKGSGRGMYAPLSMNTELGQTTLAD